MSIRVGNKCIIRTVTLLWIGFIFWNSLHTAADSSEMSGALQGWLTQIPFLRTLTEHVLRKCAHFFEFFLLGGLLTASLRPERFAISGWVSLPLFLGLFVPLTDETIQLFVEGRSGQVSDVLLDFSGALCGLLVVTVLLCHLRPLRPAPVRCAGRTKTAVLLMLTLLCLAFIWGNAAQPGAVSMQQSDAVREQVSAIAAPAVQERFLKSNFWIRKTAHVVEYACFGLLLTALVTHVLGRKRETLFAVLFGGLLAGELDECIQLLTGSRSAQVRDVWIDFGGLLIGSVLWLLCDMVRRRVKRE